MPHARFVLMTVVLVLSVSRESYAAGRKPEMPLAPVGCSELSLDLLGKPGIKSLQARIVPATGPNAAHCQVDILYGAEPDQNINIRVGLPLNTRDGGSGGVQGAWNGRTQGVGGGACSGNLNVAAPVNAGYVGSGTDTGHSGGDCAAGVNEDGSYNLRFINDFIRDGVKQQVLLSKALARIYYAEQPAYNYWNGCSTGGRQGYLLAQELGDELDGVLANAPAIYWTRFQTAMMWGQLLMRERLGHPIDPAKLNQATLSATAVCDAADGVTDGLVDDPRACTFSARANICDSSTAPAANCLTEAEADVIDRIWDGPRNARGSKIWFAPERTTGLNFLNGANAFFMGVVQFSWNEQQRNFNWRDVPVAEYPRIAQDGSRRIADLTDTTGDLDTFRRNGGKLLTFVGTDDPLIMPRGVIHYYRQMAARYGARGVLDFDALQDFYRLFRGPGVGHCAGGSGPQPQEVFEALVAWVEHDVAPDRILARNVTDGAVTRTRPLCPYPRTAIHDGRGDINDAASFQCGGNLETPRTVCADVLVGYQDEVDGLPDYNGTGADARQCAATR